MLLVSRPSGLADQSHNGAQGRDLFRSDFCLTNALTAHTRLPSSQPDRAGYLWAILPPAHPPTPHLSHTRSRTRSDHTPSLSLRRVPLRRFTLRAPNDRGEIDRCRRPALNRDTMPMIASSARRHLAWTTAGRRRRLLPPRDLHHRRAPLPVRCTPLRGPRAAGESASTVSLTSLRDATHASSRVGEGPLMLLLPLRRLNEGKRMKRRRQIVTCPP